jgi:streptomycin 6-kinase
VGDQITALAECARRWRLAIGEPYPEGAAGYAVRAQLPDGTPAVLKLIHPHREAEHEADALALWDGAGAVRLLDRDDERGAILMERCEPGTPLSAAGAEAALDVLIGLLPRLWVPAGAPFHTLADEAAWWVSYLPGEWEAAGRPFERRLLDAAREALEALAPAQGEQVLLHQDLHADNVLAAEREPWLVIDPKPLTGEREFAVAPIVRSTELGHSRRAVVHRLDRLSAELGLDRDRARGWTIGQTIAWAIGGPEEHLDVVRWLLEA